MRVLIAICLLSACDKGNSAVEEARRQNEAELAKAKAETLPKAIRPPVAGMTKLPCSQVIDIDKYTAALGEKDPLTIRDVSATDKDAAATCDLIRGGKKLTVEQQQAILKKEPRLGVIPGEPVCQVALLCSTIEEADKYRKKCEEQAAIDLKKAQSPFSGVRGDESMGNFACVQIVPTGAFDAQVFRFFDADTKCVFQVRGGPSLQDNELVKKCAQTARDTIGPQQIAVGAAPPKAEAPKQDAPK